MSRVELEGRSLCSIHIGGVGASERGAPLAVRTILGSCISVCLRDPVTQLGGMNHFMLPSGRSEEAASARYGVHAMEILINQCMRAGADRRRFEAKVFGGGHVLAVRESDGNVPQINIRFVLEFLKVEAIPIVAQDLGGYAAREVYFFTDTGRVLMRRLTATGSTATADRSELNQLEREERESLRRLRQPAPAATTGVGGARTPASNRSGDLDDNITLF